jgi:tRNA threonylcarbamoyladenosine biosynthesis protein TsaE
MQATFELRDLAATERLGRLLARHLPASAVVGLSGTLGAGKTRLVQAIAEACGMDPQEVTSPTFVLCREYHGERTIYHLDAYRLRDEDEFLELGPEEMFADQAITIIEWAERVECLLPEERLTIALEVTGETSRRARLDAFGPALEQALQRIAGEWD